MPAPPLLAEQCLTGALLGQVRKAPLPACVEADGIGRYPQDTESTVYFCALEALQNVAKYAGAAQATVGLSCADDGLEFTVTGRWCRVRSGRYPSGQRLQGMADRLAALGGTLDVQSRPGNGTTVRGWLPLPGEDGGPARGR